MNATSRSIESVVRTWVLEVVSSDEEVQKASTEDLEAQLRDIMSSLSLLID